MSTLEGWDFEYGRDTKPCIYATDVSEANTLTISDASTSPVTVTVAGAGEMPCGVAPKTVDISEDGAIGTMVVAGKGPVLLAAAVTDASIPLKCAATGTATPCTTDQDKMLGKPTRTADSATYVQCDFKLMGSYYATT